MITYTDADRWCSATNNELPHCLIVGIAAVELNSALRPRHHGIPEARGQLPLYCWLTAAPCADVRHIAGITPDVTAVSLTLELAVLPPDGDGLKSQASQFFV